MDIRVMGTREECSAFSSMIRNNVDKKYIRNISGWYANNRKGEFSTEGRIYINFRDTFTSMALEGPKELPEEDHKEEEGGPTVGRCIYCNSNDQELYVLSWHHGDYVGACKNCARKYINDQWVGNVLREEDPEKYQELLDRANPKFRGVYMGPSGTFEIWG